MLPAVAVRYMISGDEGLDANRFFSAKAGLDRDRLGDGHQGSAFLCRSEKLSDSLGQPPEWCTALV